MKLSQISHTTYKESPYKLELESQNMLARAGFIKRVEGGSYGFTSMGTRLFEQGLDHLKSMYADHQYQHCLGPSPEAVLLGDVKSFRHLGKGLLNINQHTDGEVWPKLGMAECRNKTALTSLRLVASMEEASCEMDRLYQSLQNTLNLNDAFAVRVEEAAEGGTSFHLYYQHPAKLGSDTFFHCKHCAGKTTELGFTKARPVEKQDELPMEEVLTPDIRTIQQLEEFFGLRGDVFLKTIIVEVGGTYFAVLLKGDRELNMEKLGRVLGVNANSIRLADKTGFSDAMGVEAGFIGPIGLKNIKIVADDEVLQSFNLICGANKNDYHIKNVNAGRDYTVHLSGDLISLEVSDSCPLCEKRGLKIIRGFKLATFKAVPADGIQTDYAFRYIDPTGKEAQAYAVKIQMDFNRIMAMMVDEAVVDGGMLFKAGWTPFEYMITLINPSEEIQIKVAEQIYEELVSLGHRVLLDDTDERAGVKFSNADLTGTPIRITVGKVAAEGIVEIKDRQADTGDKVTLEELMGRILK